MAQTPIVTKEGLTYYDNKIKSILSGKEELGAAEEALSSSKQYTDTELQDFASEVNASLTVLGQEIDGKAPATHNHKISDVTNLQSELDGKSDAGHTHGIADVTNLQTTLDSLQSQIDEASSSAGGAFDFDAYANAAGYAYSYDKSTMTETITYGGSTFATRTNVKDTDKWTITTVCKSMGVNTTKIWTKTTSGWTAS